MRLTRDEIVLIVIIFGTLVLGATIKHFRDHWRMQETRPVPPLTGQVQ